MEYSSSSDSSSSLEYSSLSVISSSSSDPWDITDAVVAQWKMNDNEASKVVIESIGGLDGTYEGAFDGNWKNTADISVSGVVENYNALDMKIFGSRTGGGVQGSYITIPSNDFYFTNGVTDEPFAISLWLNMRSSTYLTEIIIKTGTWKLTVEAGGSIKFELDSSETSPPTTGSRTAITDSSPFTDLNSWHHVVINYNSVNYNGITIYFDGELQTTINYEVPTYVKMQEVVGAIAISTNTTARSLEGYIDNVIIISRELTTAEIAGLYNDGLGTEMLYG